MATSHEHARREADPSGISLVGFGVDSGADGVVAPDAVINDDSAHRFQAYELDLWGPNIGFGLDQQVMDACV